MPLAISLATPLERSMKTMRPSAGACSEKIPEELRYTLPAASTEASLGQVILRPDVVCVKRCSVWNVGESFATYAPIWHRTQYPPLGIFLTDVAPQPCSCQTV